MRVLTRDEVEALLDLDKLVDAVAGAMADLTRGTASMPPRAAAHVEQQSGILLAMPAYLPSADVLATKLVSLFPHNARLELHTHQAVILAFDPRTGTPVALMDGTEITAARTAAAAALSTRYLARENAAILAIVGTGVQARSHARAFVRERPWSEVRLAGRDPTKAKRVAEKLSTELRIPIRACESYQAALEGADVVCATTHSPDPVVRRMWLSPGVHVNSVGFNPDGSEIDDETVLDAVVVVESRESAVAPWPTGLRELAVLLRDGRITPDHVHAELGELVTGVRPGRTSPDQITLYKSAGVAVQDAAAASLVLAAASQRRLGKEIDL
jgi:ornithine cyclodeaminase/alanine dehydrogenase-like protein (mu-crystallin family)